MKLEKDKIVQNCDKLITDLECPFNNQHNFSLIISWNICFSIGNDNRELKTNYNE